MKWVPQKVVNNLPLGMTNKDHPRCRTAVLTPKCSPRSLLSVWVYISLLALLHPSIKGSIFHWKTSAYIHPHPFPCDARLRLSCFLMLSLDSWLWTRLGTCITISLPAQFWKNNKQLPGKYSVNVISPNSKPCYALTQSAERLFDTQNLYGPCPLWPVQPTVLAPCVSLLPFWALWLCVILDIRVFCTFGGTRAVWEAYWNTIGGLQGCVGWQQTVNWAIYCLLLIFLFPTVTLINFCKSNGSYWLAALI